MTEEELLKRFGVTPGPEDLPAIREILREQTRLEHASQGDGDTEVMKLCCVQLFCAGHVSDALEVWRAKTASWDASVSIDIQLLCGAGLGPTKRYLADLQTDEATAALNRLSDCEEGGDFDHFSVEQYIADSKEYYA